MMEITYFDLAEYVNKNDVKNLVNVFEEIGLVDDNSTRPDLLPQEREALMIILRTASSMAYANKLNERTAWTIINYVSSVVDVFTFAHVISICEPVDLMTVDFPRLSLMAIRQDNPSREAFMEIEAMSSENIFALLNYITYNVRILSRSFSKPIIRRIFGERFIPRSLIFAFMGTCLTDVKQVLKLNDVFF